jgi:hypothetical protein
MGRESGTSLLSIFFSSLFELVRKELRQTLHKEIGTAFASSPKKGISLKLCKMRRPSPNRRPTCLLGRNDQYLPNKTVSVVLSRLIWLVTSLSLNNSFSASLLFVVFHY